MITLYGSYTSPYVRHCRMALLATGTDFRLEETDYARSSAESPARRVPYLKIGDLTLHDSASILKFIREHSGEDFFADLVDFDLFCLANTVLDTTVNLFLLERSGLTVNDSDNLRRQASRIESGLQHLEQWGWPAQPDWTDGTLRVACLLDWSQYRDRFSLAPYPALHQLLQQARSWSVFQDTAPPSAS